MTAEPLALVLHYVRQLADAEGLAALPDGQLLERFALRQDDAAFAVLVERYAGLVMDGCRRLLPNAQDAEDAFQATFLILARRAKALDRRGPLGGWLHTVAYRLALKARTDAGRRQTHERRAATMTAAGPREEAGWEELRPILDEELERLPAKYRLPLILCYLQGKTNAQAAAELGWPAGSMSRRLARARELLRTRLARRGVSLAAGVVGMALVPEATAAMPATVLAPVVNAALLFGRSKSVSAGILSARAAAWAEALLEEIFFMSKMKLFTAVVLTLCLVGGVVLAQRALTTEPGKNPQATAALADEGKGAEPSKQSYVKVRVEVEIRGTLSRSEKGFAVTALYAGPVNDSNEVPRVHGGKSDFELDFTRAEKLRESAKALAGKEVVIIGMSEVREEPVTAKPSGLGGLPLASGPGWSLRHKILVTSIRGVDGKVDQEQPERPPEQPQPEASNQAKWQRLARAAIERYLDQPEHKDLATTMRPFLDRPGHLTVFAGPDNAIFVDHLRDFAQQKEPFKKIDPKKVVVVYLRGVVGGSPTIGVILNKEDGSELAITTVPGK